jgi:signal peptidase I
MRRERDLARTGTQSFDTRRSGAEASGMNALGGALRLIVKLATFGAIIAGLLRLFYVDNFVMPHNGMAPTLVYGDQVLVWRRAKPDMGDIVVCEHPTRPRASVIGRAVAFAGHSVSTDNRGQLFVDEDRASVENIGNVRFFDARRDRMCTMQLSSIDYNRKHRHEFFVEDGYAFAVRPYQVQRGIFLLGDNRTDPYDDSREFGEVDPATCHGEVFMRLSPAPKQMDDDIQHGYFDHVH